MGARRGGARDLGAPVSEETNLRGPHIECEETGLRGPPYSLRRK